MVIDVSSMAKQKRVVASYSFLIKKTAR